VQQDVTIQYYVTPTLTRSMSGGGDKMWCAPREVGTEILKYLAELHASVIRALGKTESPYALTTAFARDQELGTEAPKLTP
jgi:hypothetical protein